MSRMLVICAVSVLALSGCETMSSKHRHKLFIVENSAYVGKTYDDLIKGKGVPSRVATLSDSGKVVEYYDSQIEYSAGGYYGYPMPRYIGYAGPWMYADQMPPVPVQSWSTSCKIDFVISPKSVVESWKYAGKGCF